MFFICAENALAVPAHPHRIFPGSSHSRLVAVVVNVDTHFCGVVRVLVVGREVAVAVRNSFTSKGVGNSAEEGAKIAKPRFSRPRRLCEARLSTPKASITPPRIDGPEPEAINLAAHSLSSLQSTSLAFAFGRPMGKATIDSTLRPTYVIFHNHGIIADD